MNIMNTWIWPEIKDQNKAAKIGKGGLWAAIGVCVISIVYGIFHLNDDVILQRSMLFWSILNAILFLVIAWSIWKLSRIAAIVGLVLFFVQRVCIWIILKDFWVGSPIVVAIFGIIFVNSIRGTFAYHRYKREA